MEPTYYVILNFSYSEYLGSEDERARVSNFCELVSEAFTENRTL